MLNEVKLETMTILKQFFYKFLKYQTSRSTTTLKFQTIINTPRFLSSFANWVYLIDLSHKRKPQKESTQNICILLPPINHCCLTQFSK